MNDPEDDSSKDNPYLEKARKKIASKRLKKLRKRDTLQEGLLSSEASDHSFDESTERSTVSDDISPAKDLLQRTAFQNFKLHLGLLLQKNYWLFSRNIKPTLTQALSPVLFCLLIVFFQSTASDWANFEMDYPPEISLQNMPRCFGDP